MGRRSLEDVAGGGDSVSGPLNTLAEIASNLLLFLLIFGMSATVDMKNLRNQLHNRWAIVTGVVMQFVLMPLLGYLTILALRDHGFTDAMGITLLIVTASPGGSYSNWWCSLFNAELALSVCMTAISTCFAVVFLPANLLLYAHLAYGFTKDDEENILSNVDFKATFISLAIVIFAIVSGLYASYKLHSPRFQLWSNRLGSISGVLLTVFSAVISSTTGDKDGAADQDGGGGGTKLWDQTWAFYLGVAAPCIIGLVLANFFSRMARLNPPEIVTVSVECCYQNVGIATSAAVAMFDDPQQRAEAALCGEFGSACCLRLSQRDCLHCMTL
jgi:predicted Na+-dependent transporter